MRKVKPKQEEALPDAARARFQEMRAGGGEGAIFTSDLTVSEFLLLHECGFEPVGLVVGTSIYHIGAQQVVWNQNAEMVILSDALYHARELAMKRMLLEAHALGADGIIGVRLHVKHLEWNRDLAEFVAIGTAVYANDRQFDWTVNGKPFSSDLSGQDFFTLLHSGYRPVGMTMGNCVYGVAHQSTKQWFKAAGKNMEMTDFTQALYDARELAMERMQKEAESFGAEGIVGMQIHEGTYAWDPNIIEFFAVGTAIVAMRADHHIPSPMLTLSTDDKAPHKLADDFEDF